MWSVLDLTDGYQQMPMRRDNRNITCISDPRGPQQWTVQEMGLKNAVAQLQRMMEWVLDQIAQADPYIDDIIVGSTRSSLDEILEKHMRDLREALGTLERHTLVCSLKNLNFFYEGS